MTTQICTGFNKGKGCSLRFDCQRNKAYWDRVLSNTIDKFCWDAPFVSDGQTTTCDLFIHKNKQNETDEQE